MPIPKQLNIGGLALRPAVTLAPMAGVTDTVFRRFIRGLGGCGLIMTEFTSSHGIVAVENRARSRNASITSTTSPTSTRSPRNCSAPTPR